MAMEKMNRLETLIIKILDELTDREITIICLGVFIFVLYRIYGSYDS